jgi:hypothetical protein
VLSHDVRPQVIFPHAHMVCREMKSVAKFPDGEEQVLIWIKDWDFAWQELYRFADPPLLPAGTLIDMTWVFDNSEGNPANPNSPPKEVIWGHQTTDEMASLSLTVVPVNNDEAEPLREAHHQYQKKQFRDVSIDTLRPVVMAELMRRFDVNENGKISLFELADILTYWEEMSRKSRGHRAWDLEKIAAYRAVDPYLDDYARTAITYASLTGISVVIIIGAGLTAWLRARRRRKAGLGQ